MGLVPRRLRRKKSIFVYERKRIHTQIAYCMGIVVSLCMSGKISEGSVQQRSRQDVEGSLFGNREAL